MLTIKEDSRGKRWHYNSQTRRYIRNELGQKINSMVCLCCAYVQSECTCGCESWDRYNEDWWDMDD